ncbi:MAG: SDR family oxidoreductase [Thermoplasmata archaeon]
MTSPETPLPRLLVVGGCGGLVGRAVLGEFLADHRIRSVHRHPIPSESNPRIEFVAADAASIPDWTPLLADVDSILTVTWYRAGVDRRFEPLSANLVRLIQSAAAAKVRRFIHISVPDAPAALEQTLPYLTYRRAVDRALEASSLDYAIVRPTMLFGPGDRLATAMLRTIHRYGRLPIFGNGEYHLSPISTRDLARALRIEGEHGGRRTVTIGGPRRWTYSELAERMFLTLGRTPNYWRLSPPNSIRLARILETLGSTLIYAYEVEWLLSDMLGTTPYPGLDRPLEPIEPFLDREAAQLRGAAPRSPAAVV